MVVFAQCNKTPIDGNDTDDTKKVKVRCKITVNNDGKSDFTNIMNNAINWSDGWEYVYVAIPGDNPQLVELKGYALGNVKTLEFEGEVAEGLLVPGEYDIWYLGHSKQLDEAYYTENKNGDVITSIEGSIAKQSGSLSDLGYCHIAKTTVTAATQDEEVILSLNGVLETQIAIAHLDLAGISTLSGNAIIGTEYSLQCENGSFELIITGGNKIKITNGTEKSYVVLLPNDNNNVDLYGNNKKINFENGIAANYFYKNVNDPLEWEFNEVNYESIDLGLPSGVKWATFNVGATTPEEYGNYYAWGETEQAAASWGGEWRMPSKDDFQELIDKCEWEWMSKNGVNGYKVIGPNGNSIFLPAAGVKIAGVTNDDKTHGGYWSSTIDNELAYYLMFSYSEEGFENDDYGIVPNELYVLYQYDNNIGMTIRPVIGEGVVEPDEQPNYEY